MAMTCAENRCTLVPLGQPRETHGESRKFLVIWRGSGTAAALQAMRLMVEAMRECVAASDDTPPAR